MVLLVLMLVLMDTVHGYLTREHLKDPDALGLGFAWGFLVWGWTWTQLMVNVLFQRESPTRNTTLSRLLGYHVI